MRSATITITDMPGGISKISVVYLPTGLDEHSPAHHLATSLLEHATNLHEPQDGDEAAGIGSLKVTPR